MKVKLNPEQTAALQTWLDAAQPVMRLGHWQLVAKADPPGEDAAEDEAFAGSYIRHSSDHATFHLGDAFWDETSEEQRETLAHELLHCHFYRLRRYAAERLKKRDRETASELEEIAIEQVARIIAPLLPLPDIPRSP